MSREPHPLIRAQATHDGWQENDDISPEAFAVYQATKSVLQTPQERMAAIRHIDELIGSSEDGTLRSRAELLNVRRKLAHTHSELLKAGK